MIFLYLFQILAPFGFALLVLPVIFSYLYMPENPFDFSNLPVTMPVFILAAVLGWRSKWPSSSPWRNAFAIFAILVFVISALPVYILVFTDVTFGVRDPWVLRTYFKGFEFSTDIGIAWRLHFRELMLFIGAFLAAVFLAFVAARRSRMFSSVLVLCAASLVFLLRDVMPSTAEHSLLDLDRDFREPTITSRPTEKKNLVIYYFEGMDEGFAAIPSTASIMAPLVEKSKTGLVFRGIGQYPGTEYSAASYVATQCGVPLAQLGILNRLWDDTPEYIARRGFMPSITCLSDVLENDGYESVFINGANLSTFAIREFLETHQYSKILDLEPVRAQIDGSPRTAWGYDDDIMHGIFREELRRLRANGAPFLLAFENIGTHGPDGFPSPSCLGSETSSDPKLVVSVRCGVRALIEILDLLTAGEFAKDTLVLVVSDHLMLQNQLKNEFEKIQRPRNNMAFVLNSGRRGEIQRDSGMFDIYPTILGLLGYEIEGFGAGIGTDLLGPEQTLVERNGRPLTEKILFRNPLLAERLWQNAEPSEFSGFRRPVSEPGTPD